MVPFESSLAVIGGYDGYPDGEHWDPAFYDDIYLLTCSIRSCSLSKMEQKLSLPRSRFVTVPIPDSLTSHC